MSDKPLSERITTDFLTRVNKINEAKQDIYESNMLGEHGMRFRDMAMTKGIIVGVRDLSGFAGSQLADKLSIGEAGSPDPYGLEALGKDFHVKAKSSVFEEIGGLIPAQNILSKKPEATEEERLKKDQYFASLLDAPDSEHKFVTPTKNVNGKDYDICFFQNTNAVTAENPHGVKFAYRDSEGQVFADPRNPGTLISDPMDLQGIRDVKVYADKSTGLPLIPDYDLAIIGSKKSSMDRIVDPDRGVMRPEELAIVEHLEKITHNMVRHAADTENPTGYKFEMSEKRLILCIHLMVERIKSVMNKAIWILLIQIERKDSI